MVNPFSFLHFFLVLCFFQFSILSSASGFTVDLIHRDSPLSPLYNASERTSDRLRSALIRSHSRATYLREVFSKSKQNLQAPIVPTDGEYLIKLTIGTPPSPVYGIIDTGSDLSWTQCSPCDSCYKQDYPLFDPTKSSTYKPVLCSSNTCQTLDGVTSFCAPNGKTCEYQVAYGDGSTSAGEVAIETFTFGTTIVPNLTFACGHNDNGKFKNTVTGIVGLGPGKGSFANQLSGSINGKFSYCFTSYNPKSKTTSKISFGDDAVVSGPGVVSTPIVNAPENFALYPLKLESVKLGNKMFPHRSTNLGLAAARKGNVVFIDSGTTLTILPSQLVDDLENELKQIIKGKPTRDPTQAFQLCYNTTTVKVDVPAITFQFTGAAVEVPQSNAFLETDGGLLCLGIVRAFPGDVSIIGNLLQVNFLVGYDTVAKKVSFKPTDCSKQ